MALGKWEFSTKSLYELGFQVVANNLSSSISNYQSSPPPKIPSDALPESSKLPGPFSEHKENIYRQSNSSSSSEREVRVKARTGSDEHKFVRDQEQYHVSAAPPNGDTISSYKLHRQPTIELASDDSEDKKNGRISPSFTKAEVEWTLLLSRICQFSAILTIHFKVRNPSCYIAISYHARSSSMHAAFWSSWSSQQNTSSSNLRVGDNSGDLIAFRWC